jgi:hypothetical protein
MRVNCGISARQNTGISFVIIKGSARAFISLISVNQEHALQVEEYECH